MAKETIELSRSQVSNTMLLSHLLIFLALTCRSGNSFPLGHLPSHIRDHVARRVETLEAALGTSGPPSSHTTVPQISKATSKSRIFHVTDYGADPSGITDSTAAIKSAISDAFRLPTGRTLFWGIKDLGGAEIHLDGGAYLISSPLTLPSSGGGNFKIVGGSVHASNNFPRGRYLIELWTNPSPYPVQRDDFSLISLISSSYHYEYITLRDLMLDANFRSGGIAVVNSLRTTIDNCYIVHFISDGIWVRSGHETYIQNSYIGQHITAGGNPHERDFSGIGINLMGNDNAVTNVVVFSAEVGVQVAGQANALSGVHCYNKAAGFGGIGIHVKLPGLTQTRIVNCYLDYTGIVAEDPVQLHISGSFFLGAADVVLTSIKGVLQGLQIVDNTFAGDGDADIVRLVGRFWTVEQVNVRGNVVKGMRLRSTLAAATVEGKGTRRWEADFSRVLLFPGHIKQVQYSFECDGLGFPNHALRNVSGNRVVVESDVPVTATVRVVVDQNAG